MRKIIAAVICIVALGFARTSWADISFSDSLFGIDGTTAGIWSSGEETASLGTDTWGLLGGLAAIMSKGGVLTHRLSRGVGVSAGEADEIDGAERLSLVFSQPFWLNSFEVRSLFKGEAGGTERGRVALYNDGALVGRQTFTGEERDVPGAAVVTFAQPALIDRLVFYVPNGRPNSEFALAKVSGSVAPEPVSASLFVLGAGALGARLFRRRR